jgi:hypothetical protein
MILTMTLIMRMSLYCWMLCVCVCVCVFLFNGRRPVPITRVLNIPCWDKSRQVVKPGFQIYIYNLGPQRIYIAALGGQ